MERDSCDNENKTYFEWWDNLSETLYHMRNITEGDCIDDSNMMLKIQCAIECGRSEEIRWWQLAECYREKW